MKFPGSARTIIKSRIRNHPQRDAICGTDPATITNATTGDLGQWAMLMGLGEVTQSERDAYDNTKANGGSTRDAMAAADAVAAGAPVPPLNPDANPTEPEQTLQQQLDEAIDATPAKADTGDQKEKAAQDVAEALALFGGGNMAGFNDALMSIAMRANRPDPKPERIEIPVAAARNFDASKIAGHVPSVVAHKMMADAGIEAADTVRPIATKLAVYDAPDAPGVDPNYIWPENTGNVLAALAAGQNVFLTGERGTGKSTFAEQVAARWHRPIAIISCDDQTDAPTLVGQPGLENGSTIWEDGQLVKAIRTPGTVVLIDEPSAARPGALIALNAVLADTRELHIKETGETVPVAPGVIFLMADNTSGHGDERGGYEGTRAMNVATLDRNGIVVELEYLPPEKEALAIHTRTGLDRNRAAILARLAATTRGKARGGDLSAGIGFRRLLGMAVQLNAGADPSTAYQLAVVNVAPYDDREPLRQIWTAQVNPDQLRSK